MYATFNSFNYDSYSKIYPILIGNRYMYNFKYPINIIIIGDILWKAVIANL